MIPLRMLKSWDVNRDNQTTTTYPQGLVISLEPDLALVGVAIGRAEALRPLDETETEMLVAVRRALAGEISAEQLDQAFAVHQP